MYAEMINDKLHYFGEDYEFTLTEEKFHNYRTLIVTDKQICWLKEPDQDKQEIIDLWFGSENEWIRQDNNKRRREKRNEKN